MQTHIKLIQLIKENFTQNIKFLRESNRQIYICIFRHIISPVKGTCTSDYSLSVIQFLPSEQ